ncbi:MAG: S8 family serine peptidase [Bacteroidota bacterium]
MKISIILCFTITLYTVSFAQNSISGMDKNDWSRISSQSKFTDDSKVELLKQEFPINKIGDKDYISVIAEVAPGFDISKLVSQEIIVGSRIGNILSLKIPLINMQDFSSVKGVKYYEIAKKVRPNLNKVIPDIRADSVHDGINLPEKYTGKDVFIGVCDWGFDYTHPMYYDTAMTQTRIFAAWDQYKTSGPHPAGFTYGTEYSTIPDLLAAGSDTANIYSYAYHGGHVAGIAGGGGAGTPFLGVAFEAQFLFATFLIDAGSVLDAYQWMFNKAQAEGKRLVINQSWGLHHIGNLDGTSLLSQAIDAYSAQGVIFVTSGGNNGDVNFHLEKQFAADTLKSKIDFYSYSANPNMWGQSITAWGEAGNEFTMGINITNSSNVIVASSPMYSTVSTPSLIDDIIVVGTDTIFYKLEMEAANAQNGRPHARFRVKNTHGAYRVILQATAPTGTVHFWNVTELITDVGNWGMPFSVSGPGTVAGNHEYGIGEPACSNSAIAVAAHLSNYYSGPNLLGGQIATFSSNGPTLDGRVKPDISAPGVSVASSVSSFTDNNFTTAVSIMFNGQTYKFTRISGTSMSGPAVAGVVALLLDANPFLEADQIKEIIKNTARTDNHTGIIPAGGSLIWGAGKVNAYSAIQLALNTVDIEKVEKENLLIYPNPAQGRLFVKGNLTGNEGYEIIDFQGKVIDSGIIQSNFLDIENLQTGAYILKISSVNKVSLMKFIVE